MQRKDNSVTITLHEGGEVVTYTGSFDVVRLDLTMEVHPDRYLGEPDPDRGSFAGPPADREMTTEPQKRHDTTRTLPRGSACADRYGKTFVVWPDGSHGYDTASRIGAGYSSHSFGPYTVLRDGLTAEQCDDIAAGDRCGTDPIPEAGAA